ncbi:MULTISPECIES: ABC transporter transmembrane domain-containing protein [Paenibacillus]|uniref:Multidrug ABC transporter ATPase n=1 Tax=Paenibacillus polymyxa (strain SC2) TaxID=886882 RepID=E3EAG4_PAEPS|nr:MULTISPECIES: ABC transporter ATP-binding protein [Paenibacillus]ADO58582.1 multidrug ABC transporter ATPase [Paenibacillus polymyxa SC2]AJE52359.1 multidrug ABC transporter ATPase [Paenibacillus polymyxa]KAF6583897.1 ABC transporter ATP-binding protein [Paenibacillus sp. EKM211P]KJD40144.1 multidrug ABC transporter ATPase [Paenibacillus polymyxa]MDU8673061.1 ABC transporter ATP-binding protein [Paenibacillus polymyxa]
MLRKYNWIFKEVHKFYLFIVLILVFQALDTILSMIIPQYISKIVDSGLVSKDLSLIVKFIGIATGLFILSHLCSLLCEFIFAELGKRISYAMKKKLLEKFFVLPGETITSNSDKLFSLFINDIGIIERLVSHGIPMLISNLLFLIVICIVLLFFNYKLFTLVLLIMLLTMISQIFFNKRITHKTKAVMNAYDDSISYIRHTLGSLLYSIGMDIKDYILGKYMPLEEKSLEAYRQRSNTIIVASTVPSVITSIGSVLLLGVGTILVMKGQTSMGVLTVFVYYSNQIISPIKSVTNYVATWKQTKVSIERIESIIRAEEVK